MQWQFIRNGSLNDRGIVAAVHHRDISFQSQGAVSCVHCRGTTLPDKNNIAQHKTRQEGYCEHYNAVPAVCHHCCRFYRRIACFL